MKVVVIGGCSGSGKTYLARSLTVRLPGAVEIALDSYYLPQAELSIDERSLRNYDHPDALEWPLLTAHLEALAAGREVEVPKYLFDRHTRSEQTRRVSPAEVLVLEGILALHHPGIRELAAARVFVDTSADACLARRLQRDMAERGRSEESVREQCRETVWPMAQAYVLPSRAHADLIVSGEHPVELAVEEIVGRLAAAIRPSHESA